MNARPSRLIGVLYDLGHLFEAAVAHYQATGKKTLLDIAIRAADLLTKTFGPGKRSISRCQCQFAGSSPTIR